MSGGGPGRRAVVRRASARPGDEDGSILLLTLFYGFLALVLILVTVAATSLYLERKRLLTLADGAALAGAEAFDLSAVAVTTDSSGPVLRAALVSADVHAAAAEYLDTAPHGGIAGLELAGAASVDGKSATVTLTAYWRPPVLAVVLPAGVPMEVTAVARSVFR
ncbi:hypothetical protein E3O49_00195 [Cryobacterium shii]|uniref:Putative Flp pilus-assembly TadG-like N-terminal domain-containing protein n=1 Tax=Cryobacterium shii TaxID=1259235 RepID=A0AAQ2C9T0_9MICO|nr:hypothetical protein E3O49_00195 [Cryobacterium shii]